VGVRLALLAVAGAAAAAQSFPEGPGRETFQSVCSFCHSPTAVLSKGMTRQEWREKVTEMLQEEEIAAPEQDQIIEYLARNFPKPGVVPRTNVNAAPARLLEVALALSSREAEAVVRYRAEKGAFKTLDDLKQVPGLEAAKIEAERDRIAF
jgi:competence protein ComEA